MRTAHFSIYPMGGLPNRPIVGRPLRMNTTPPLDGGRVTSDACWDTNPRTNKHLWKHYLAHTSFAGFNKKICQCSLRTVDGEYDGGEVSSAVGLSARVPRAALRAAVRTERERAVLPERVPAETRRPRLQEKKHSILRDKQNWAK